MSPSQLWIYVGTYTHEESRGIYRCDFDLATGKLTLGDMPTEEGTVADPHMVGLAAETEQPSFVTLHPTLPVLYCANELSDYEGEESGAVSAFQIEPGSGRLHLIGRQPSRGAAPCHVSVDPSGRCLFVANYRGGSVTCFLLEPDGRMREASSFFQHRGSSIQPTRQTAPHAHSTNSDPGGRFVFAPDLGQDKIVVYRLDAQNACLTAGPDPVECTPGSGPRHMVFSADARLAYVINELSSAITVFRYDSARGALERLDEISTLPGEFAGENTCGEVALHPSGRFLYASNRGHDSIAVFAVDADTGNLSTSGHQSTLGEWPRHFCITPKGEFLLAANQYSDTITVFAIDAESGALRPRSEPLGVPSPVCLLPVVPVGNRGG